MVSLFDISVQKPLWSHLSTGVPTLDSMLDLHSEALIDMQSVPSNAPLNAMLCTMMASHLSQDESSIVAVIETLGDFDWDALLLHPAYSDSWFDEKRIHQYKLSSLAEIYSFFAFMPLAGKPPGSVLLLIPNFHETVEFYRLQLSATYEELLLQHYIDQNRTILQNIRTPDQRELRMEHLPQLPPKSILLRENPYKKAQSQIDELFVMMSDYTMKASAVIVLIGHLEPKFRHYSVPEEPASSDVSFRTQEHTFMDHTQKRASASRLVLQPVLFTNHSDGRIPLAESKITSRLVFYFDWYFKSPHFKRQRRERTREDHYLVPVVKCITMGGVKNITEPVYFDLQFVPGSSNVGPGNSWFIDFSEQQRENLSAFIQNMTSTQIYNKADSTEFSQKRQVSHHSKDRTELSSWPPLKRARAESSDSADEDSFEDAQERELSQESEESQERGSGQEHGILPDMESASHESQSFIEGSDVESTGTLFEDVDCQPDWLLRHS